MENELEKIVSKLTENVEVMNDENSTNVQKAVAIEQAKHHSQLAFEELHK
jgi:hypothetical protein